MDYAALRTDILARAECAPYVVTPDMPKDPDYYAKDSAIAALLNALEGGVAYGKVSTDQMLTWAAATGMLAVIQDTSVAVGHPLRSSALALLLVMRGAVPTTDFGNPQVQAMLQAWVDSDLCSSDNHQALLALCSRSVGYAELTYGRPLTPDDISIALRVQE